LSSFSSHPTFASQKVNIQIAQALDPLSPVRAPAGQACRLLPENNEFIHVILGKSVASLHPRKLFLRLYQWINPP